MNMVEFANWLSEMERLSGEQIALALTELGEVARRSNDGRLSSRGSAGGGGVDRGGRTTKAFEDRAGRAGDDRRSKVERLGCPHCARRDRRLGPVARLAAISLQGVRAHLQRRDQDGDGPVAQEGALARPGAGDDRRRQPGQGGRALRRPSDHGLSLAASVPRRSGARQAAEVAGNRGSGRNLHPRIVQGPALRSDRARPASGAARPGIRAPFRQHSRSRRPRPSGRHNRRRPAGGHGALHHRGARGRHVAGEHLSSATAAGHCAPSPDAAKIPVRVVPAPGKPLPGGPTSTSTTSTPITADSRNGCVASTASRPRTCPTIWAGAAPSKPAATSQSTELALGRSERPISTANAIRADISLRNNRRRATLASMQIRSAIAPFSDRRGREKPRRARGLRRGVAPSRERAAG